nr:MAG TPA: hypothetical protein [Caudoviricetes sp.]
MLICYHAEARWRKLPSVDIVSAIRYHTLAADLEADVLYRFLHSFTNRIESSPPC